MGNDKRLYDLQNQNSVCVHFCQLRKMYNHPTLKLDGSEIPVVNQYKFLGIIFHKKLSFTPHIQYLKDKCNKTLKLLHIIAHKDWGADQHTLLKLYRTLIHSKIDYGCVIYGATRKTYFKPLIRIIKLGLQYYCKLKSLLTNPAHDYIFYPKQPSLFDLKEKTIKPFSLCMKHIGRN